MKKNKTSAQAREIEELLRRAGITPGELAEKADVNPATLMRILRGYQNAGEHTMHSIRRACAIPAHSEESAKTEAGLKKRSIINRLRYIHVVSWAQAGEACDYEDLPEEWMKRIPTDSDDNEAFGVEIKGDSMEPKYSEGETAILMPTKKARNGDLVVARLKNNGVVFKLFHLTNNKFHLTSYNTAYPPLILSEKDFHWIYPVHSVVRYVYH